MHPSNVQQVGSFDIIDSLLLEASQFHVCTFLSAHLFSMNPNLVIQNFILSFFSDLILAAEFLMLFHSPVLIHFGFSLCQPFFDGSHPNPTSTFHISSERLMFFHGFFMVFAWFWTPIGTISHCRCLSRLVFHPAVGPRLLWLRLPGWQQHLLALHG